jgi:hypothetical protein
MTAYFITISRSNFSKAKARQSQQSFSFWQS